jgi:hypothetical protein
MDVPLLKAIDEIRGMQPTLAEIPIGSGGWSTVKQFREFLTIMLISIPAHISLEIRSHRRECF